MDQLEERILQICKIDQLKNASKRLQHCVDRPVNENGLKRIKILLMSTLNP